jgi:hypothetical protein
VFVADAVAVELFTWVAPVAGAAAAVGVLDVALGTQTLIKVPSRPEPFGSGVFGSTFTETFPFVGELCVDVADAFEVCVVGALWSTTWD